MNTGDEDGDGDADDVVGCGACVFGIVIFNIALLSSLFMNFVD